MTATIDDTVAPARPDAPAARPGRARGRILYVYTWIVIAWLILPILVMYFLTQRQFTESIARSGIRG